MLGRGRPPKVAAIGTIRELSREEVMTTRRARTTVTTKFRDSHHRIARLFASGLRVGEVAELTGYSISRVSLFHNDPTFQALIQEKRAVEDQVHKDQVTVLNAMILTNGLKAERKLADRLDDDDEREEMSVRELVSISRDSADRVGLSKRLVQTNFNVDFADMLDKAIKRSGMPVESLPRPSEPLASHAPSPELDRGPIPDDRVTVLPPIRRRL